MTKNTTMRRLHLHWSTGGHKSNTGNVFPDFDVLLTVHLSIVLVINQLNAQILVS